MSRNRSSAPAGERFRRLSRLRGPLAVAACCTVGAVLLRWRDPHEGGAWGRCPTAFLTGYACPLCGGMRAVNDLTHADLVGAFHSNALFVVTLPVLLAWWLLTVRDRWRGSPRPGAWPVNDARVLRVVIVLAAVFTVVRNLPVGRALYP